VGADFRGIGSDYKTAIKRLAIKKLAVKNQPQKIDTHT